MTWPPISLDTPIGELADQAPATHLAATGIGVQGKPTLALMTIRRRRSGQVHITCMDVGLRTVPPPMASSQHIPASASLSEVLLGLGQIRATAAGRVPHIRWPSGTTTPPPWLVVTLTVMTALSALSGALFAIPALLGITPGLIIATLVVLGSSRGHGLATSPAQVWADGAEVMQSTVRARLVMQPPAGPSPTQRVDQVKASYAELLSDIVYRIENSALFDTAVAETRRFELALLAWDPASPEAESLASDVEESFAAARTTAERLGLRHLPETAQPTARRAAKAAAVATGSASAAERRAAATQAAQLLRSLALYWMPSVDPETPSLLGVRKMIEPAP